MTTPTPFETPVGEMHETLGRLPSGLFVLTVRQGLLETGMLASWVMQAGFDPPALTVAIRQERYVRTWITEGCPFVLNMLAPGQRALVRRFSRGFPPGGHSFSDIQVDRTESGIAILRESIGYLECQPDGHIDSGDHRVFLARVIGGKLFGSEAPVVHIRKSGLHY
jgi:flavin reductase (DIM6/NTAB) family NADH-FMN oxidoreductase RutF